MAMSISTRPTDSRSDNRPALVFLACFAIAIPSRLPLAAQLFLELSEGPMTLDSKFDMGESAPVKVRFSFT